MSTASLDKETERAPEDGLRLEYDCTGEGLVRRVVSPRGVFEELRPGLKGGNDPDGSWWLDFLRGETELHTSHVSSLGVVDLFCGAGGLSLGAAAGASSIGLRTEHEFAADSDPAALGVFRANHRPRFSANESISNLVSFRITSSRSGARYAHEPQLLNEELGLLKDQVDLLLAGPPCQGHSTVNNRTRFNDPRNLLYLAVPAVAVALNARAIVIENVPGVTASREGVVKTTSELLASSGYSLTSSVLRSDSLGWPQTRKRFFLVATREWDPVPLESVAEALRQPARPVSWALEELLDRDEGSVMTESPLVSDANRARIDHLHDNDLYDLPNEHRPDCHQAGTTYKAVYGRMHWDAPAPTLTTGFMTAGRGRYVHPLRRRTLVPREAARLQGFPDTYRFETPTGELGRGAVAKGIGDAVPSILGYAAAISALGNRPL